MKCKPTKANLIKRADACEEQADKLKDNPSYKAFLECSALNQESQNLREWAEHGALIGRPDSVWAP